MGAVARLAALFSEKVGNMKLYVLIYFGLLRNTQLDP